METGAIRKRTPARSYFNPNERVRYSVQRPGGEPAPAGRPAGRSAILRKHAASPPRASYQC
jgi:hypothetical protein